MKLSPTLVFPSGSDSKEFAGDVGDPDSIPGLGRSPGEDLPASSLECIHLAAHVLEAGCLNRHHLIDQMVKNMPAMEETQI